MIKRLSALWRIFVVVALVVLTHNTAYSNKVGDGGFTITFTPDGKVEELCSGVKSVARLVAQNNNDTGFSAALKGSGDALRNVSLSFDSYEDGVLVMSNREVEVKLRVKSVDEYITMHIIEVNESVEGSLMKLRFRAPQNEQVALFPLDWMSDFRVGNKAIEWAWIWGRNDKNPLGSFALTLFNNDKQHDETLIKIWVDEGLPHIKVDGEWTYERAEEHLKQWQEMFEDQSTMIVQPTDNADLYHLTDYAKRLGMKKIYLHTDTWRGEYWPINHSFLHLNEKIFPNGEEDFKRYGDYCREQELNLAIHTICGSIGRRDPDYARDGFHEDLATWVRGTLEEPIDATAKVIKFRPEAGSVYPKIMGHGWRAPNTARQWMHTNVIQIGDELIRVGKFADTSKEVWTLQNCVRAHHSTTAASHEARTPSRGLYASYGQSYVADADSELMDEVIERFMSFDNRNGVTHVECDGLEIYEHIPWGVGKYQWKIVNALDHPVTSNSSNGTPIRYQLEYWFRSSQPIAKNQGTGGVAGGNGVPIYLDNADRVATTPYEILLKPSQRAANGGVSINLMRPIPMFGVSRAVLDSYGLTDYVEESIGLWREVYQKITPAQSRSMLKDFVNYRSPLNSARNQRATDVLHRPERVNGELTLVPLQVITQPRYNMNWGWGQEFGPLVPWQYAKSGETLTVNNPYSAQSPELLLRLMPELVEADIDSVETEEKGGGNSVVESYLTGAGQDESNHPLASAKQIWSSGDAAQSNFRRSIFVENRRDVTSVKLVYQTAGNATIYVNEHPVFTGGGAGRAYSVDISHSIREGENVVAIYAKSTAGGGSLAAAILCDFNGVEQAMYSDKSWLYSSTNPESTRIVRADLSTFEAAVELRDYGVSPLQRAAVRPALKSVSLMPEGKTEIVLEKSNKSAKEIIERGTNDRWRVGTSMSGARGVAMRVVGDGSGALLHLRLAGNGGRDYVVPIDFKGERDIIIPNGEVASSTASYGWVHDGMYMQYGNIAFASIHLARVPAKCDVKVTVSNLRIMQEVEAPIDNLTIKGSSGSLKITGRISTGQYMWYRGGDKATIYDKNWNAVGEVAVESKGLAVAKGESRLSFTSKGNNNVTFQYLLVARGKPIEIK